MKKAACFSFILAFAVVLAGCQKAVPRVIDLRLSDRKVEGVDLQEEKSGEERTEVTEEVSADQITETGTDEATSDETPETAADDIDETTSEAEREMTTEEPAESQMTETSTSKAPETTEAPTTNAPLSTETPTTKDSETTEAPLLLAPPVTTAPPVTEMPETTEAPAATEAPTTTEPPATTASTTTEPPTTTEASTTTEAPTTEPPTTTEDTIHTEANLDRIEIRTLPDKTVYDQYGELISTEGMTLNAFWADGFTKVITGGWTIFDAAGNAAPRTSSEGTLNIYVSYGNRSTAFTITYHLAEDAPLRMIEDYTAARIFYQGEYVRHLFFGAWVGDRRLDFSELTVSQDRLTKTGQVTIRFSYGKHTAERSFTVVPASAFVLTMADLEWLNSLDVPMDMLKMGARLSAKWFYEQLWAYDPVSRPEDRPVITDFIPDEEFAFDPEYHEKSGAWQPVTISCRGLSHTFHVDLY